MISNRVKKDDDFSEIHKGFLICRSGKKYRVYREYEGYSGTTGGYTAKGRVMRDAGGKAIGFATIQDAVKWIDEGCRITDKSGREIEF